MKNMKDAKYVPMSFMDVIEEYDVIVQEVRYGEEDQIPKGHFVFDLEANT